MIVDDNILDKSLKTIKETIGIKQSCNIKILIDRDDKLPDNTTLKNAVILMKCGTKDGGKFCPQRFLEDELYDK